MGENRTSRRRGFAGRVSATNGGAGLWSLTPEKRWRQRMKFNSLEHYRINPLRFLLLLLLLSLSGGAAVSAVTRDILGSDSWIIGALTAAAMAYLVGSEPRRKLDTVSLWQAREAPVVAASAAGSLRATRSNARALLHLRREGGQRAGALVHVKRLVLLGHAPKGTIREHATRK